LILNVIASMVKKQRIDGNFRVSYNFGFCLKM